MLSSKNGPTITDVTRSMKRIGFSKQEIYDILTGAGISGGETQMLIDRIENDFEDAKIGSRKSRLGKEVEKIFSLKLKESKMEMKSNFRKMNENLKSMIKAIERLEDRTTELQSICCE